MIEIRGARVHNLKNIDVQIPRNQLVVITGPSGSGKSSLAFDTIYAEGQRRYVESLSTYARQFLDQMGKPDVDFIGGLSPTISIEQKSTSYNPRSTVGTVTEVYDYLRLLYSRIGKPYCYSCGKAIQSQSPQQIVDQILGFSDGTQLSILSPIVRERKGEYQKELSQLRQRGFVRVRIDAETRDLSENITLDRNKKHSIDVYVDRLILKTDRATLGTRVSESVDLALKLGEGLLTLQVASPKGEKTEVLMSEKFACATCNISYPSPEPRTFSFNSPMGACETCDGLGIDPKYRDRDDITDPDEPTDAPLIEFEVSPEKTPCPSCNGARLRKESLHFKIASQNIFQICSLSIEELLVFFRKTEFTDRERLIAGRILKELTERVRFLDQVGVGYLTLGRSAQTLSGGEAQRIRLATQIGTSLVGVIYVLDEPSIGLHQKDNNRLLETLENLRDLGNTVIVVEHDLDTMLKADYIVDIGPGAGTQGGEIVVAGTLQDVLKSKKSITGQYLKGTLEISIPKQRRRPDPKKVVKIKNARQNNLKKVSVDFPLGLLTVVTGVSGSGKSTLVIDTLYKALAEKIWKSKVGDLQVDEVSGIEQLDKVIDIDQSPIGRTPRSNPSTYTGMFGQIRELFAQLPDSKIRGYAPGRYSFNVKGGRCETCEGGGLTKIEMHFLPDVYVLCEICKGKRYNRETLEIKFKGKNIAEVLDLTGAEALSFFDAIPSIKQKLTTLNDVGLGYLKLGQSATTLSGGEAQRIKLARELSKRATGKTFYILDEPSTGLHFDDIKKLIQILQALVDQGNTVVVIEHHLDIIKSADYVIDLGPLGGKGGGTILAKGTPEEVSRVKDSFTGQYLKKFLK